MGMQMLRSAVLLYVLLVSGHSSRLSRRKEGRVRNEAQRGVDANHVASFMENRTATQRDSSMSNDENATVSLRLGEEMRVPIPKPLPPAPAGYSSSRRCGPIKKLSAFDPRTADWANDWKTTFRFECPGDEALSGIYTQHDATSHDRRWKYLCSKLSPGVVGDCSWTGQTKNGGTWQTPSWAGTVLTGVMSVFDKNSGDRSYNFKLCAVDGTKTVTPLPSAGWSHELRGDLIQSLPRDTFFDGVNSAFAPKYKDRVFEFRKVKLNTCASGS
eukprot:gnl/TRDRNA2_/TRDRNA2_85523_c0_seq1.p1 gnl/TRDRNA2_/TRDRNA2_85523_c0~~gnl/TRDRNA2_/TRDRNA2_85523_c0_seq1.p1  ORF type:complete len:271 (-),score=38.88 gnl/TRDRNA2_/TRDRNA2_85523_c0_seq1:147-959(-)